MADATFDGVNLLITLPSGQTGVDTEQDIYSAWKRWVTANNTANFPPAFRTIGGDPLTPGIDAGAYFFIRNDLGWRIKPAEEDATVLLTGNLAPQDSSLPILIPTTGNFSVLVAGLQPVTQAVDTLLTQQQESLYQGSVTINTFTGTSGTEFPTGTESDPVNNLADAIIIANNLGLTTFNLTGIITLNQSFQFWRFNGTGGIAQIDLNGQDVSGSLFNGVGLIGDLPVLSQPIVLFAGQIGAAGVTDFRGSIGNTVFAGNISIAGDTGIVNCVSNIAGNIRPMVDVQGNNLSLSIRKWAGGVEILNFSHASATASLDIESGTVDLDSTCTAGQIVVRGVGNLINNSAGSTVIKDGWIDGLDLRLIKAIDAGRAEITGSNPFVINIYDEDNVTVIRTLNVTPDGRTRTVV